MNKIIKYKTLLLVLGFSLFLLFIPDQVHGFVLDLAKKQVEALSAAFGFTGSILFITFIFFLIGYFFLLITTALLQGIIIATPTALTVTGDSRVAGIVRDGWELSAGIVNLILIIAFIVIAFAVILGSEKIELKKAFPKLIMVALLVNFTLLFVGIGIDVSNFLFNTVAEAFMDGGEGGNIFYNALRPLFDWSYKQMGMFALYTTTKATALLVPYVSSAVQLLLLLSTTFVYSGIFQFIFYGAIMWALSGVFFLFYIVFLSRIFIIQILAMLAPLAFFCLIFDDTRKWWTKWLDTLVQWLLVGVIFIFLMSFALALAPLIQSLGAEFALFPPVLEWFTGDIVSHIILLIYFLVVISFTKSFAPAAANALISQTKGVGRALLPYASPLLSGTGEHIRAFQEKRQKTIKDRKAIENPNLLTRIGTRIMEAESWAVRRGHNIAGTNTETESEKDIESAVKDLKTKHGDNYKDFAENFRLSLFPSERSKIAVLRFLSEGGAKALSELDSESITNFIELAGSRGDSKTVNNAVRHIPDRFGVSGREEKLEEAKEKVKKANPLLKGDALDFAVKNDKEVREAQESLDTTKKAAEKIEKAMMSDIKKINPEISILEQKLREADKELNETKDDAHKKRLEGDVEDIKKKIQKEKTAAIYKISVRSLKPADIENLSSETLKNKGFLRAIVENKDMNFIKPILDRKDASEVTKDLTEIINKMMDINDFEKANPTLYNQIKKTTAGQGMFSSIHKDIITREEKEREEAAERKKKEREEAAEREKKEREEKEKIEAARKKIILPGDMTREEAMDLTRKPRR